MYVVEGVVGQDKPHYHLDVPVRITTEAGEESLTVYLEGREKNFRWKGEARPVALAVDPDFDLFRKVHLAEIPVSLSRTLGADSTLVVVQNDGDEALLVALGDLAGQWSGPGTERVEGSAEETDLAGKSVFLLGRTGLNDRFVATLPKGVTMDGAKWVLPAGEFTSADHSLVITARHPVDPDLSWTLLLPENAEVVPSLGRKIPHYGKYGYLVFQGTENVAKGEWSSGESPLYVKLKVE